MFSFANTLHGTIAAAKGFIKTNKSWLVQGATCLAIVSTEVVMTYQSLIEEGASIHYAIARSCGAAIKIISLVAMFPLARVAYSSAQNSTIGKYLGLDRRIIDHTIFSTALIAASSAHAAAHFFHNPSNYLKQPGITGAMMLGSLTLPIGGLMLLQRHIKSLHFFGYGISVIRTHQAGVCMFIGAYFMHTPDYRLVKYAIAACAPLAIDRVIEKIAYTHGTQLQQAKIIEDTEFMSVRVKKPAGFIKIKPGQYALLSFKSIDQLLEPAHPFTIVSEDSENIHFLIKRTGPWTAKLFEHLQKPTITLNEWSGAIAGPFGQSLLHQCFKHSVVFIGAGVGITPMMAMLHYILFGEEMPKPISLCVIQRKLSEVRSCMQQLNQIEQAKKHAIKSIDVYLTRENNFEAATDALAFMGIFKHRGTIQLGRPHFENIVQTAEAVNVCGSAEIVKSIESTARKFGKPCYTESF
jgi:ferredoxin-NADP reductase